MEAVSALGGSKYPKSPFSHERVGRTIEQTVQSEQLRPDRRFETERKSYHIRSCVRQSRFHNHLACQDANNTQATAFQELAFEIQAGNGARFFEGTKIHKAFLKNGQCGNLDNWRTRN